MLESVGHYRILDKIGSGIMGDVYRARDTRVGRTVALRLVAPAIASDPALLAAFLKDARASAAVSHPNIAALYEVGEDAGINYLACEFIPGQTLRSLIAGQPLNPRRAIDLTVQIADALADGYANEIVDGNLSADTVIINAKGNAKLLDFGLAQWAAPGRERTPADHPADVAALGLVMYEMLTGRAPRGGTATGRLDAHLPQELDAIVRRTQSGDLNDRYEMSAMLAADLRSVAAVLDARTKSTSDGAVAPAKGARGRTSVVWVAVVVAIAAFGWLLWTVSR